MRLLLVLLAGCLVPDERPQSLIVCHNANCARATDPFADDTLCMLDESLRLEYRGRPAIDGIEIDTVWDRLRGECMFAHDLTTIRPPERALDAAQRIVDHLARPGPVSWGGDAFFVKVQLKTMVLADGTPHEPHELATHIDCVHDIYDRIAGAARTHGRTLEFGYDSDFVRILRAVAASPRWPGKQPEPGVTVRLIGNVNARGLAPRDLASLTSDRDDHGVDVLAFHATETPTAIVAEYAALGAELMLWMRDAAPETLDALAYFEPAYVVTNEALLLRRWEEQ